MLKLISCFSKIQLYLGTRFIFYFLFFIFTELNEWQWLVLILDCSIHNEVVVREKKKKKEQNCLNSVPVYRGEDWKKWPEEDEGSEVPQFEGVWGGACATDFR